eukprot:763545-Hanusia_phi.AAC.7
MFATTDQQHSNGRTSTQWERMKEVDCDLRCRQVTTPTQSQHTTTSTMTILNANFTTTGQGSFSGAGANAQYVSIVQDTMRSYDRDYPAVSSFHAKDAGGEFGCSFSHRSLAVCELPPCSDEFCHVRLKVQSPDSKEIVIVDVPWTVVNDGGENLSTSISCTDNEVAPFDRNLQCMKVRDGVKRLEKDLGMIWDDCCCCGDDA